MAMTCAGPSDDVLGRTAAVSIVVKYLSTAISVSKTSRRAGLLSGSAYLHYGAGPARAMHFNDMQAAVPAY
jgi:hypothetical protein